MSGTLFQQELEELKALREVATEYGWADDDPSYIYRKNQLKKKYTKLASSRAPASGIVKSEESEGEKKPTKKFHWATFKSVSGQDLKKAKSVLKEIADITWLADRPGGGMTTHGDDGSVPFKRWYGKDEEDVVYRARALKLKKTILIQYDTEDPKPAEDEDEADEEKDDALVQEAEDDEDEPAAAPAPARAAKGGNKRVRGAPAPAPEPALPPRKRGRK